MATFNVDSLDFSDDEEVRVGSDDEYGFSYDSGDDALEIEDRVNTAIASIPRGTSTDLVGGKFAETVSEGKALADDGNVYDSIQDAVDAANSWVKVGPGTFNESVTIDTEGLTLEGSGDRTVVDGGSSTTAVLVNSSNVTLRDFSARNAPGVGSNAHTVDVSADGVVVDGLRILDADRYGIKLGANNSDGICINCVFEIQDGDAGVVQLSGDNHILANCVIKGTRDNNGIYLNAFDSIIFGNTIEDANEYGIFQASREPNNLIGANILKNCGSGIRIQGDDSICFKNRLQNSGEIENNGDGNILDSNLVTE